MHELKCIQAHPMGGTQLAQQLREWRYGHDDAGQLGASSHRKASRTLVEVRCALRTRHVLLRRACVCRCTRDAHACRALAQLCVRVLARGIAAGRLELLEHGPWVPVEFLEAAMRTASGTHVAPSCA